MTQVQAVFSTPLILPSQFLDSSELPSDGFLTEVSCALSAKEHHALHKTPGARRPCRRPPSRLSEALACAVRTNVFVWRDGHVLPSSRSTTTLYLSCGGPMHHFTLQMRDKTDKMSALRLKAYSGLTAAPRGRLPIICFWDFPSPGDTVALKVHFAPPHTKETFPLVSRQGVLHVLPRSHSISSLAASMLLPAPDRLEL
jgi:hypothetical protein